MSKPILSDSSTVALRRFFQRLELHCGGLPLDSGPAAEVISSDKLQSEHLERLTSHQATAVHIRNFYPCPAASLLGQELSKQAVHGKGRNWKISTSRGLESSDVFTLGEHPPYNIASASNDPVDTESYFAGVAQEHKKRRLKSHDGVLNEDEPQLWPLDLFRLELDECWSSGAGLARESSSARAKNRRPFSGGLPRVMIGPTRWRKGFIHVDEMGPLCPNRGLFSANIYLQLPSSKNDPPQATKESTNDDAQEIFHIWPLGIRSRWDWYRNALLLSGLSSQDAETQMQLRAKLGPPTRISVRPGDLVLLCAQRPHAAVGFDDGIRVSLQCFFQHEGPEKRLLIDS